MSDTDIEKQEGQKTVVAFIAGLLIGGLLVWVFSASPEDADTPETQEEDNQETVLETEGENSGPAMTENETVTQPETVSGDASIAVSDQGAGSVVVLDSVTYPTNNGWVVVRDYVDGVAGNILGAARYSQEVGLLPTSVSLLRATEAGAAYQVVFYSENGDRVFDLDDDVEIDGFSATFTAN